MRDTIPIILNELIEWSSNIYEENVNIGDRQREIYIATYFSTEIQYCKSLVTLFNNNNFIGIPPVFRSLFEAHIDLINLCHHEDYHLVLFSMTMKQTIKDLEAHFKEPDNPFLQIDFPDDIDIGSAITKLRNKLNYLKGKTDKYGKNIFQIRQRVKLAKMDDTYSGIYRFISSEVHNDLFRVHSRHVNSTSKNSEVSLKNQWSASKIEPPLVTIPDILINSLAAIFHNFDVENKHELLQKKRKKTIDKLEASFSRYRKQSH